MLRIKLFGDFHVTLDRRPLNALNAERIQSLLVYLVTHRGMAQSRQHIAFQLWPESSESQARTNLRNLLHGLRQALPDADRFVETSHTTLRWRDDAPYWLDVENFEVLLDEASTARQSEDEVEQGLLRDAIALYDGELVPGIYEDWLLPLRHEYAGRYRSALTRISYLLEASGEPANALVYVQKLQLLDPLNESIYVQMMRLHSQLGDRSAIRSVYATCVEILRNELDIEPSRGTQAAYRSLLQAAVPSEIDLFSMPLQSMIFRTATSPPLPALSAPLIGRELERTALTRMLYDPSCRMITLTGVGGVGKSHLALQVAHDVLDHFADGVVYMRLASRIDKERFEAALATSLCSRCVNERTSVEDPFAGLPSCNGLLVLDGFEHLIEAAPSVSLLLSAAPSLKVLITSRQRLDLDEEWVYRIFGLNPASDQSGGANQSESVRLFTQVARRIVPDFVLDLRSERAIERIGYLVDYLPLGLVLAAGWVPIFGAESIAAEVEKNLDFLSGGRQSMPDRQRSLQISFEHSWHLLSQTERESLVRLASFNLPFSPEEADHLASVSAQMLISLHDRSLLRNRDEGRFELHRIVRHFTRMKAAESHHIERNIPVHEAVAGVETIKPMRHKAALDAVSTPLTVRLGPENNNR